MASSRRVGGRYDFIIVGGGSAGSALANRLSASPGHRVLVLEAGRSDYPCDVFIHMPAALPFPIGSRFYDWKYESEPEPHMNGRRIYHARGKVLGGSSSINGMIFQRGNPLDYERWAADPGMQTWDYAHCLPYFKRMETCMAGADEFRGDRGPLVLERGPATNPLFGAFFEAVQQAGYPLTDDVNGYRQEGFARVRPQHPPRPPAVGGAGVPAPGDEPAEPDRADAGVRHPDPLRRHACDRRRVRARRRRGRSARSAARSSCAAARSTPRSCCSCPVSATPTSCARWASTSSHDLPGVGENLQDHLEVYIQYACKQPVSMPPMTAKWRRPFIGAEWLFLRKGPGATNHFEGGGFARSNDEVAYPNLMFHFLPIAIRYDGSSPAGGHGYQVHVGPMYSDARGSVKITSTDPRRHPALRFNYLSTEQDRREWVEAVRVARDILNQPAFEPFNGGELSPGPSVSTDDEILDWVARDGETALHPSCTCRMGVDDHVRRRPAHHARARRRRPARRRRVGDAVRHERQHLRAGDDARREGRRPHPRPAAAGAVEGRRSTGTRPPRA